MTGSPTGEDKKPPCYGRIDDPQRNVAGWNPSHPECAGGPNPTYIDANGGHMQPRCDFFQSCGSAVQAQKVAQARSGFIDPKTLLRPTPAPTMPTAPIVQHATTYAKPAVSQPQAAWQIQPQPQQQVQQKPADNFQMQQQQRAFEQQMAVMRQQMEQMQRATMMQPMAMQPMQMGYQQMMPVNYQMPSYLTVPEPMEGGFWGMFGRTVLRSMGKSVGHSVAHMFDTIPYSQKP